MEKKTKNLIIILIALLFVFAIVMNVLLFYVLKLNNEIRAIEVMASKPVNKEQDGEKTEYINEEYGYSFEYYDLFLNKMESKDGSVLMLENEAKTIRIDTYVEENINPDGIFEGYINNTPNIIVQEMDEGLGLYYEVDDVNYYQRILVEEDRLAIIELRFTEDKEDLEDLISLIKESFKLELVDGSAPSGKQVIVEPIEEVGPEPTVEAEVDGALVDGNQSVTVPYGRKIILEPIEGTDPGSTVGIEFNGSYATGSIDYVYDENHCPLVLFEGQVENNQIRFRFEDDGFDNGGTCHISFYEDNRVEVDIELDDESTDYYSIKPASGKYKY